jgi:PBP1b-binding outer membrane lipoprotein LpoB
MLKIKVLAAVAGSILLLAGCGSKQDATKATFSRLFKIT